MMYKYEHGGDIYTEKLTKDGRPFVDYSANINPLGLPLGIKQAVQQALKLCINYPDPFCRELAEVTASYLQLPQDYIFFGNGAADVLFRLALALKPGRALLLAPTFADYEKALRTVDCKISYYNLQEARDFAADNNDIVDAIAPDTDLVVICNPNNPTGQLTSRELLVQILDKCRLVRAHLLIDECFMDFVSEEKAFSMRDLLATYPELVILKAFTKTFAMPGIRLGYCLSGSSELITALHQSGQDWNVSILAQEAGKAALKEHEYLAKSFKLIEQERSYLRNRLAALGAKVYGSEANYIFFYLPQPENLPELLHERGYLIRSCANYHNLQAGYYRIAVKTRVQNRGLIKALKEAIKTCALY
ncbi:pyridoxal phosphate-dependent aminotransferase [Phascolarctobacterium succinatutens]